MVNPLPRTPDKIALGIQGEELAAAYLRCLGLQIRLRNYRTRLGEIDIIAADGATWVFVEVRTRRGEAAVPPLDSITQQKRRQVRKVVADFLYHQGLHEDATPLRIDAIGIVFTEQGALIQHVRDAL
jgi:putative endonuclease